MTFDPSQTVDDRLVLRSGDVVTVSAQEAETARPVDLYFLGTRWRITETRGGQATINVDDFARWGVGRYKAVWGADCSKTIDIEGPFFGSVAAIAATATLGLSLAALLLTLTLRVRIANPDAAWVLRLIAKGKLERDDETGRIRPTFSYTFTQTLLGTLLGLILGGASLVALQQAALTPPTIEVSLEVILPLTLIGALAGLHHGRPRYEPPADAETRAPA